MSEAILLGRLKVTLERQAIRLAMAEARERVIVRPLLGLELRREGRPSAPLPITEIHSVDETVVFSGEIDGQLRIEGQLSADPATGGLTGTILLTNSSENPFVGALRANLTLQDEAEPYWMVPGFLYSGISRSELSAPFPLFDELQENPEELVARRWSIRSDRPSVPVVFCWTLGLFAWVACDELIQSPQNPEEVLGASGLHFGLKAGEPVLGFDLPFSETPCRFSSCHPDGFTPDIRNMTVEPGQSVGLRIGLGMGRPDLHAYAAVMAGLWSRSAPEHPQRAVLTHEDSLQLVYTGLSRWHCSHRLAILAHEIPLMQGGAFGTLGDIASYGSGGGMAGSLALLKTGTLMEHHETVIAAVAQIEFAVSELAHCGTIYPSYAEATGWCASHAPAAGHGHSRAVAEAVYFLLKAIEFERLQGREHPTWIKAADSSLRFAVGVQDTDGAFPTYFDLETGTPLEFESDGGIAWMAACALGAKVLAQEHLRDVAFSAATHYAERLRLESLAGSLEGLTGAPSCDEAAWGLIGWLELYQQTQENLYLALARRAADLHLTWRRSTNSFFAPLSIAGRYGIRTRGGTIESVARPNTTQRGLLIYDDLRRLSELLGEEYYRQRADESLLFAHQFVAQEEGQFGGRIGMVLEGIACVDHDRPKGTLSGESSLHAAALLALAQLARMEVREKLDTPVDIRLEDKELRKMRSPEMFPTLSSSQVSVPKLGLGREPLRPMVEQGKPSPNDTNFGEATASLAGLLGLGGDATPRRTSSTAIPKLTDTPTGGAMKSMPTPLPMKTRKPDAPPPAPKREPSGNDEIEIKYKIF